MNLSDDKIFEILMTSEFSDGYKKEEFIFLLNKFRYFYRSLHSKSTLMFSEIESIKKNKINEINILRDEITKMQIENADLKNKIDLSKKKKSWIKAIFKN